MLFKVARHTKVQIALAIIIVSSFLAVPVFAADYSCDLVVHFINNVTYYCLILR